MAFDITGKLYAVADTKQVSDRFSKRDFVVEIEDGKYPQLVSFQIVNDKIAQLDGLNPGDQVSVSFNLRGREWRSPSGEVKYFNTLDAWKVTSTAQRKTEPQRGVHEAPPVGEDDIPF